MNILHISALMQDEVSQILKQAGEDLANYKITMIPTEHIEKYDHSMFDIIILGIGDGGINLKTTDYELLTKSAQASGVGIIFTHDCLIPRPVMVALPSLSAYDELLPTSETAISFSDTSYKGSDYVIFSQVKKFVDHKILSTPYDFSTYETFKVQETHNQGLCLDPLSTSIVLANANFTDLRTGFYLATQEIEEGTQGRVVYTQLGHCNYNAEGLFHVQETEECQLFTNMLQWASKI